LRYSIKAGPNINITEFTQDLHKCGAEEICKAPRLGISFVNMSPENVDILRSKGYKVQPAKRTGSTQTRDIIPPPFPPSIGMYYPDQVAEAVGIKYLERLSSPPLLGSGVNVALLDTGVRRSHSMLLNRVVHEWSAPGFGYGDDFDHGTGVASIIASVAERVNIISCKVLDENGDGTEIETLLALDYLLGLFQDNDPFAPDIINMSIGTEDTPDYDEEDLMREAVNQLADEGIWIVGSIGNSGPGPETAMSPASARGAIGVGSCALDTFVVSQFSSRGPTSSGLIKPDCLMVGENVIVASSLSDDATVAKSGTSVSAPFVSGILALINEYYARELEDYPETAEQLTYKDILEDLLPLICVKPSGVTPGKDNSYGYGVLYPGSFSTETEEVVISGIADLMYPMVGFVMMGMIMPMMMKEINRG